MTDEVAEPNIVLCDQGIANRHENTIYINRNLLKPEWAEYYGYILQHEKKHSFGDRFYSLGRHALIDTWVPLKYWLMSLKFMAKHPGALMQLSPVRYIRGDGEPDGLLAFDWISVIFLLVIIVALQQIAGLIL